jgi:hypothetical protein
MKGLDVFIVRFLPFILYIIFVLNVFCACTDRDPFISYELHGNSAFYALGMFLISLANKRYHCAWNRAMYIFLIFVPTLNYLDSTFALFEYEASYMWFVSITTALTALITAYLAIRHFIQISKRRMERGN